MRRRPDPTVAVRVDDLSLAHAAGSANDPSGRAVDGVTFELTGGRALVVMGPTGSGKSTLLAALSGQSRSDLKVVGGDGWVVGHSLRRGGRSRRIRSFHVGYVPQKAGQDLPPRLTVGDIIGEPVTSRDRRVNRQAVALRCAGLLDEVRLPLGSATRFPYELSAGMRQRVAFARALMLEPKVLVADDPLANLDQEVRKAVIESIRRRQSESGMSVVLGSNDMAVARALDADVLVLRHGHTVAQGHHASLQWSPGEHSDANTGAIDLS